MEDYYNTNRETGETLKKSIENAQTQQKKIKDFFMSNDSKIFTPCEIWAIVFAREIPITSVRRAITNLTNQGVLCKTGVQKIGFFGKMVHAWGINCIPC